jgi:hypothetical protein
MVTSSAVQEASDAGKHAIPTELCMHVKQGIERDPITVIWHLSSQSASLALITSSNSAPVRVTWAQGVAVNVEREEHNAQHRGGGKARSVMIVEGVGGCAPVHGGEAGAQANATKVPNKPNRNILSRVGGRG